MISVRLWHDKLTVANDYFFHIQYNDHCYQTAQPPWSVAFEFEDFFQKSAG